MTKVASAPGRVQPPIVPRKAPKWYAQWSVPTVAAVAALESSPG